jgi:class 3 adenylate cyclase
VPRQRLVHILQLRNELAAAAAEQEIGLARARRTGDVGETSFALSSASAHAAITGDLDRVEALVRETLGAVERSRYPFSGLFAIMTLGYVRYLTGGWNDAKDALLQIESPGAVFDEPGRAVLGLARAIRDFIDGTATAWTDTDDTSVKRRERLVRQARAIEQLGQDVTALGMGCILLEHAAEAQVHEAAQYLLPPLMEAYDAGLILAPGWPVSVPRVIGLGLALLGQEAEAKNFLGQAIELAEKSGARPELTRARLNLAHLLAADRNPEPRAEARRLLDFAYGDFITIGMVPYARRAESLAHGLGLRLEPGGGTELADKADVTLLRGIGAGHDAGALETELLLSRTSVEQRLNELGTRLDTDSTAETIAEAIDRRIVTVPAMPRVLATFVVTDIVDSTSLLERLGDEQAQILVQAHNRLLRAAARDHSAREVSYTGDGFILASRVAPQAVACAVAIQRALLAFNARPEQEAIAVRIGLDAGEPLLDEERLFGRALVSAVRVCGQAEGGQILISEAVRALASDIPERLIDQGMHQLKGFRDPLRLYEVDWEDKANPRPGP